MPMHALTQTVSSHKTMLPLSLYIHIPWCIRKCPYCDFNSHKSPDNLPEEAYVAALLADLNQDLETFPRRELSSIFIGGGTPSLFSAQAFDTLLTSINQRLTFSKDIEITLEANPGTVEQQRFTDYRTIGINRLSIGIQSFNPTHLKALGRIHDDNQAHLAVESARRAGFDRINLDVMHGLPSQTVAQGLADLQTAIDHQPEHISWYQLTIEPNTAFYKQRPALPTEDDACTLEENGFELLATHGYNRYEISAFTRNNQPSRHNMNYWTFGDYLGIGAGAHGKLTHPDTLDIIRTRKQRQPTDYLNPNKSFLAGKEAINVENRMFEFMLNTTRLQQAIPNNLFTERTGLSIDNLMPGLLLAQKKGLIIINNSSWQITSFGRQYTNDLQSLFLPD